MRNRIILVIILILSIILLFVAMFHGIKIGSLELLSISQLKQKNNTLDQKINKASTLTTTTYPSNIKTLKNSFKEYTIKKEKYEELSGLAIENKDNIYETKQYDISYLWRVLGKYAKNRSLTLGIDVQRANNNSQYNLNFSVSGGYTDIIRFVTDIENDSDLYFRIYDFKMSGSTTVQATFVVKNINVDPSTIKVSQTEETETLNSLSDLKK